MKFKKFTIIMIIMIILANSFIGINISKASSHEQILTIKKGTDYGATIKENNATLRFVRTYYQENGEIYPVYCLDKSKPGVSEIEAGQYQVKVTEKITDLRLWRIVTNSYPFKTCIEMGCDTPAQAFIATKAAIDIILYNKDFSRYSSLNYDGDVILSTMKTLLEIANDETIQPNSTDIEIIPIHEWRFEKNAGKVYIARAFKIENDNLQGNYTVGLRGHVPNGTRITNMSYIDETEFLVSDRFKVLIPMEEVTGESTISIAVSAEVKTMPIYDSIPINTTEDYQNYLIPGIQTELGTGDATIPYEPIGGALIITKTDAETKEKLADAKFNVYDSNNKLLYENLKSDENGEIKLYNLITDTYYVEETKAPEGYDKIEQKMEIKVIEGSTSNLIINNSKTVITNKENHKIVVEIVENNKVNNSITENEYHKQETSNTTNNNTEINNTYIDKTNNNTTTNTVQNNTTTNTTNNTTVNNNIENNTKEETTENKTEINNIENNTNESKTENNKVENNTTANKTDNNKVENSTTENKTENNKTENSTTENKTETNKTTNDKIENTPKTETKAETNKNTITQNIASNKKLPKTGM